ncbi:cytochrome b/b6 domain-containing protein, partial [Pelagibacteraceae bacterium]|nr:cytochrome b/b6 domain-containing protein [Pelagibacteraceae bacterium]
MIKKNNNKNYSSFAKVLHWGFIILFIYGIAKQVNDLKQLEDIDFFRFEIIFALLFLIILLIRLIYMKTTQKTSLPDDTPKVQKMTAKVVHNGMYILLFGTALSGLLIGFVYWLGFKNGSLVE